MSGEINTVHTGSVSWELYPDGSLRVIGVMSVWKFSPQETAKITALLTGVQK